MQIRTNFTGSTVVLLVVSLCWRRIVAHFHTCEGFDSGVCWILSTHRQSFVENESTSTGRHEPQTCMSSACRWADKPWLSISGIRLTVCIVQIIRAPGLSTAARHISDGLWSTCWVRVVRAAYGQTDTTESTDGRRRRCQTTPADTVAEYRGHRCRTRLTDLKEPGQPRLHGRQLWWCRTAPIRQQSRSSDRLRNWTGMSAVSLRRSSSSSADKRRDLKNFRQDQQGRYRTIWAGVVDVKVDFFNNWRYEYLAKNIWKMTRVQWMIKQFENERRNQINDLLQNVHRHWIGGWWLVG